MKHEQRERIIEILKQYGEMIGTDSAETDVLIGLMKQIYCKAENVELEKKILNRMHELSSIIEYTNDTATNKCRQDNLVAMRDAIARMVFDEYGSYPRITELVGEYFDKDRTTGIGMDKRSNDRKETKDNLFMYYYQKLLERQIEIAA